LIARHLLEAKISSVRRAFVMAAPQPTTASAAAILLMCGAGAIVTRAQIIVPATDDTSIGQNIAQVKELRSAVDPSAASYE
jgi:hypothetical protein